MPSAPYGQLITFAIELDRDDRKWYTIPVSRGDTIARICAKRGHPEDAREVANKNQIRSVKTKLGMHKNSRKTILIPQDLKSSLSFSVLAGEKAPTVVEGYQKLAIVNRPQRAGLTMFEGYDPIAMDIPIWFEGRRPTSAESHSERQGEQIEDDIALLERMAGRGVFSGAATGPAPIVRITVTKSNDEASVVPLIPRNYQRTRQNPQGPLWRIEGITWDDNPLRNKAGNRIRQLATVRVRQHTETVLVTRSVAARTKGKKGKKRTVGRLGPGQRSYL